MKKSLVLALAVLVSAPSAFATSPMLKPCIEAAHLAASALNQVNSSAWEINKYGIPNSLDIFPIGSFDESITLVKSEPATEGEMKGNQITYRIKTQNANGNVLSDNTVIVNALSNSQATLCSVKSISAN
jgi:hypothetical protein